MNNQSSISSDSGTKFKDVFVAVHGIGAQRRFATVRSVATQMANSTVLRGKWKGQPVATQPLGYFNSDVRSMTSIRLLDDASTLEGADLASIGFAEVFWADIPQDVVKEGRTLDETKAWARTVVARAHALCQRSRKDDDPIVYPPDFGLASEVLDEVIDTLYVLENLFYLAGKAGFFKFDLKEVLEEYLGDVQLVTEFTYYRTEIVARFHQAMEDIYQQQCKIGNPDVRIHIVAHSEGTVVSFLGLLHAMSERRLIPADPVKKSEARIESQLIPLWLTRVRGYMTLGSPLDKHILLWRRLWEDLEPKCTNDLFAKDRIRWRNYFDFGDPVGFKLDSTRQWLHHVGCKAFQFCGCKKCRQDMGFARYLFPGKAHNDYWEDCDVFEHFIKAVVKPEENSEPTPPPSKWYVKLLGPFFPYLISFLILAGGVFLLHKAVHAYTHPNLDPLQKFVRFTQLGVNPRSELSGIGFLGSALGITALVAGATLLARLPRLARSKGIPVLNVRIFDSFVMKCGETAASVPWFLRGIFAFVIGALIYCLVPREIRGEMGDRFRYLGQNGPTITPILLAAVAGLAGYLATLRRIGNVDRRQRWFWRGTRPLIFFGALAVAGVILLQLLVPPTVSRRVSAQERQDYLGDRQAEIRRVPRSLTSNEVALIVAKKTDFQHADIETVQREAAAPGPDNPQVVERARLAIARNELKTIDDTRRDLDADKIALIRKARLTPSELDQIIINRGTNWVETVEKVLPVLAAVPPVWPVALAGIGFLYLWWLATLVFDLAFIWHRYIRHSLVNDRLREWNPYGFPPRSPEDGEPCYEPSNCKEVDPVKAT